MEYSNKEMGVYLNTLRSSKELSTHDVQKIAGVSSSYLSLIENGKRKASAIVLKKLSSVYNVPYLELYEKAGYVDLEENVISNCNCKIPVLGIIPAGVPFEAIEDIIDEEEISTDMIANGNKYFGLRVRGDSMEPEYINGDTLIILQQNYCDSGDDAVVMVNGDDATFKRVFKNDKGIVLQPLNSKYQPMVYSNEQVASLPITIVGIVEEIRRKKKKSKVL